MERFYNLALRKFIQLSTLVFVLPMLFMDQYYCIITLLCCFCALASFEIAIQMYNITHKTSIHTKIKNATTSLFKRYDIGQNRTLLNILFFNSFSALLSFTLFDRDIAIISFLVMVLGDAIATLFGTKFHSLYFKEFGKTFIGSIAMFLTTFTIIYTCADQFSLSLFEPFALPIIAVSMIATIAELICGRFLRIDDGVVVVTCTGLCLNLAMFLSCPSCRF